MSRVAFRTVALSQSRDNLVVLTRLKVQLPTKVLDEEKVGVTYPGPFVTTSPCKRDKTSVAH